MIDYGIDEKGFLLKDGLRWLRELAHWYGVSRALSLRDKERYFYDEIGLDCAKLKIVWYWDYGCLRVGIRSTDRDFHWQYPDEFRYYQILNQRQYRKAETIEEIAFRFDEMAHAMFPGIQQGSSYHACFGLHDRIHYGICSPIGAHWLCEECINRFSLMAPVDEIPAARNPKNDERAKLTPSLRFDVLERDNFTCRGCGASPLDDGAIKLHVDHIQPIAHGGKTTLGNLQVLCSVCNLGKSDKITSKMGRGAA